MPYELLADAIVAVHLIYLVFLIIGGFLAWRWLWMLWFHLAAVAWAVAIVVAQVQCPLTVWERGLRRLAEGQAYPGTFIGHYIEGPVYPAGYTKVAEYVLFGVVLVSYIVLVARRLTRAHTRL